MEQDQGDELLAELHEVATRLTSDLLRRDELVVLARGHGVSWARLQKALGHQSMSGARRALGREGRLQRRIPRPRTV